MTRLSLTSSKASNWVDRGAPPVPVLERVLVHFFDRHDPADQPWITRAAEDVLGMVHADATEIHIAGYLRSVAQAQGFELPPRARITSIALWHIAKAAMVRDTATALLNRQPPIEHPSDKPLAQWLAERLLSPEELAAHDAAGRALRDD